MSGTDAFGRVPDPARDKTGRTPDDRPESVRQEAVTSAAGAATGTGGDGGDLPHAGAWLEVHEPAGGAVSVVTRKRAGLFMAGMLWSMITLVAVFRLNVTGWRGGFLAGLTAAAACTVLYRWWMA